MIKDSALEDSCQASDFFAIKPHITAILHRSVNAARKVRAGNHLQCFIFVACPKPRIGTLQKQRQSKAQKLQINTTLFFGPQS